MKKTFALLLACLLFIADQKSNAQTSKPKPSSILTASQFMQLLGAGTDRVEDILPSSFVRIESGAGKTTAGNEYTSIRYRRNYKGTTYLANRSLLDYDAFGMRSDKVIDFETTDPATFKKYKESLKKYGFKWMKDTDGTSWYVYSTYAMYIKTGNNLNGNVIYNISIIP
jgi:hypothetical protein